LLQGYGKVLAKGRVAQPVIVRTRFVSRRAEEKIKAAGGGKSFECCKVAKATNFFFLPLVVELIA
jgi:ribosomal protein L18E